MGPKKYVHVDTYSIKYNWVWKNPGFEKRCSSMEKNHVEKNLKFNKIYFCNNNIDEK